MTTGTGIPSHPVTGGGTVTLPVRKEELRVGTRVADTGRGLRVHKNVVTRQQQIQETLWSDTPDVRRVPVDRIVDVAPPVRYDGDTLIVPVLEEILVVEKRYRIKEELHISKIRHASEHAETVPLRTEEITLEWFDDNPGEPSRPAPPSTS